MDREKELRWAIMQLQRQEHHQPLTDSQHGGWRERQQQFLVTDVIQKQHLTPISALLDLRLPLLKPPITTSLLLTTSTDG